MMMALDDELCRCPVKGAVAYATLSLAFNSSLPDGLTSVLTQSCLCQEKDNFQAG